jgi:hypothetical protein
MHKQCAIVEVAKDLRGLGAVFNAFDRIGERFTVEAVRVGQDFGDRPLADLRIAKRQHHAGQKNARAPIFSRAFRLFWRLAARNPFGSPLLDELFLRPGAFLCERSRRRFLEARKLPLLVRRQVRNRRFRVERRAGTH